ncbi:MAG TPA: DinB family protein [Puia sp.]|nr:DinB family protein [Puia sp.]
MRIIQKAKRGDYPEYAEMYMKWIPDDGLLLQHLKDNFEENKKFIYSLPESLLHYRYEEGKWSIKEILVHIVDDERIYAYRALCFARGEKEGLPGFDQDAYAAYSGANERSPDSIFEEYEAVRNSTITLFKHLPEEAFDRMGHGTGTFAGATVRALGYHIAGHEQHHMNVIRKYYLSGFAGGGNL